MNTKKLKEALAKYGQAYTVDEIVQCWKKDKVAYIVTDLPDHSNPEGPAEGGLKLYEFKNKNGQEQKFKELLDSAKTPIYRSRLSAREYKKWTKTAPDDWYEAFVSKYIY